MARFAWQRTNLITMAGMARCPRLRLDACEVGAYRHRLSCSTVILPWSRLGVAVLVCCVCVQRNDFCLCGDRGQTSEGVQHLESLAGVIH